MIEGEQWDVAAFIEGMSALERSRDDVPAQAAGRYYLANRGNVWETWGFLWPHCPRWYLEFGDPIAIDHANEIVRLRSNVKMGIAGNLGEQLTPAGQELLSAADRHWDRLQRDLEKEKLDEARRKK